MAETKTESPEMYFLLLTVCHYVFVCLFLQIILLTLSPPLYEVKNICFAKYCFTISLAPTVFQVLHMHYATSMFGNTNSSLLCSNIALHAAYITRHSYYGIIRLFFSMTVLLLFSIQMQILLDFII